MSTLPLEPLKRLTRDLATASATLSVREARYLVDQYYMMQENRISASHQVRTLDENAEPHDTIGYVAEQSEMMERQIKRALDAWTNSNPVGVWAKSICGIGPVISAGLLAHIDIKVCPTVAHIWSFAGLDPTKEWKKGQKRPFNGALKTLAAFKLGESFVKVQNNDSDVYGKVFAARKKLEQQRNEALAFADQAALRRDKVGKATDAYKAYAAGKLPPAQIHARSRRYAVKLFLAHFHCVSYFAHFGVMPPFPYVFSHLPGHVDFIAPPHAELIDGLVPALADYVTQLREREPQL